MNLGWAGLVPPPLHVEIQRKLSMVLTEPPVPHQEWADAGQGEGAELSKVT